MANTFVEGDTASKLEVTCKEPDGTLIDLTSCVVVLHWRVGGGSVQSRTMTVTDAANGVAEYQFEKDELTAGTMSAEVDIKDASLTVKTCLEDLSYTVKARIGPVETDLV